MLVPYMQLKASFMSPLQENRFIMQKIDTGPMRYFYDGYLIKYSGK
jgi:hypothetical protein